MRRITCGSTTARQVRCGDSESAVHASHCPFGMASIPAR